MRAILGMEELGSHDGPSLTMLAPELLFSVLSFVDGKALSSHVEALLASNNQRSSLGPLLTYLMKRWHDEVVQILSTNAQPALVSFVQEHMVTQVDSIASADNSAPLMRQFSEWCILFDYVMQGPRSASSFAGADRMVWPVGVGVFATTPVCGRNVPLRSKVLVHCPVWNPMAVILCHGIWLSEKQTHEGLVGAAAHFSWLPSEGDIDGFLPDENIGFLTPFDDTNARTFAATKALTRDDDFLPAMGRPDSCLSIVPALDSPIYGSLVNYMVRASNRNAWMLEEQRRNRLALMCFFVSHPNYTGGVDAAHSKTSMVDRIIHLMKTCRMAKGNLR